MTEDTDNTTGLSRRRLLGSVATIGGAAALGGAGSVAFLSDREDFANNRLVAGALDLKVDWEEHYSDWSEDESEGLENDVLMEDPMSDDYTPLPERVNPLIWVHDDDLAQFMDNTAIEAYPDTDDDGIQDAFAAEPGETTEAGVGYICEDGADTPEDLDPNGGTGLRTLKGPDSPRGEATVDADGNPLPLVDIQDVKPGDFGELTLSVHVCDNDGYVYLQADNVMGAENGYTEPERKDEDESGDADGDGEDDVTELLDEIQTVWWYDGNGDNVLGGGGQASTGSADIAFLFDRSGSMSDERNFLANNISQVSQGLIDAGVDAQFALVPYEDGLNGSAGTSPCGTYLATDLTDDPSALDFSYGTCGGNEDASEAIEFALDNVSWRDNAQKVLVVLTDEDDDGTATQRQNAIDRIESEDACLLSVSPDFEGPTSLKTIASQVTCGDWTQISNGLSEQNIDDLVEFVGGVVGTEQVFLAGSLRDTLDTLSTGEGFLLDGDPTTDGVDPFEGSTTNYIAVAWSLPVNHANEIQTDSVQFDLGFYTEQARHNDPTMGNTTT